MESETEWSRWRADFRSCASTSHGSATEKFFPRGALAPGRSRLYIARVNQNHFVPLVKLRSPLGACHQGSQLRPLRQLSGSQPDGSVPSSPGPSRPASIIAPASPGDIYAARPSDHFPGARTDQTELECLPSVPAAAVSHDSNPARPDSLPVPLGEARAQTPTQSPFAADSAPPGVCFEEIFAAQERWNNEYRNSAASPDDI